MESIVSRSTNLLTSWESLSLLRGDAQRTVLATLGCFCEGSVDSAAKHRCLIQPNLNIFFCVDLPVSSADGEKFVLRLTILLRVAATNLLTLGAVGLWERWDILTRDPEGLRLSFYGAMGLWTGSCLVSVHWRIAVGRKLAEANCVGFLEISYLPIEEGMEGFRLACLGGGVFVAEAMPEVGQLGVFAQRGIRRLPEKISRRLRGLRRRFRSRVCWGVVEAWDISFHLRQTCCGWVGTRA